MSRRLISTGSVFEEMAGYSRAVVDGDWVFVSGTAGYDFERHILPDTIGAQTEQALQTITNTLAEAGASLQDVVQVRVYLSDRGYVGEMARVLKQTFDTIRPTNTTIICQFAEPEMKVEIEVVALKRR